MRVELGGVPETLLWTLYHRALEARRPDGVLEDPLAVELVGRIEYPFAERFGAGEGGGVLAQWQALRVRRFDEEVRRFARASGDGGGTVVALGEGLETQFWRVDDGRLRWLSVDVAEAVDVRRALLPAEDARRRALVASAFDVEAWAGAVDPAHGVLLTAQGLLMYFAPEEVRALIAACAARFPGSSLVFDALPAWLVARSAREGGLGGGVGGAWRAPPWAWGWDAAEARRVALLPGVRGLTALPLRRGRGLSGGVALPAATRLPGLRGLLPRVLRADFA
jgi:O-methyltransferase involved in polyketide biosynthesis